MLVNQKLHTLHSLFLFIMSVSFSFSLDVKRMGSNMNKGIKTTQITQTTHSNNKIYIVDLFVYVSTL